MGKKKKGKKEKKEKEKVVSDICAQKRRIEIRKSENLIRHIQINKN